MTVRSCTPRAAAVGLALLAIPYLSSCGGGGGAASTTGVTRSEVYTAILDSTDQDSDGDGIPDDVERRYQAVLGTDPTKADSDGDGVNDAAELFGSGWLYVHTRGRAGTLGATSPAAVVSDPSLPHEAETVDSDGDGVADYLEMAGYRYDWAQSKFVLDPNGFHTDPMQYSTDQDPYSDGMEASGLNMDVAVRPPGDDPLVPAFPDVQVELTGYTVTLNKQVTSTTGGSLEEGSTWNRQVEKTHSQAFEAGIQLATKVEFGLEGIGASLETTYSFSSTTTDTSSIAVATGGSMTRNFNWNEATAVNPTEVAKLKLYIRVHNRGTAPATNVVPTVSLRIGGADIATFEPPDLSIAMLLPGASFPPDPNVSWVVERVAPEQDLLLADWELRALESGAPVTISIAQKRADVMRFEDGAWVRVGDVNDYVARILSSSADLFVDVGAGPPGEEGQFIHSRVAADDGLTAPLVTLGEALRASMGFQRDPGGGYSLLLPMASGARERVALRQATIPDPEHPGSTIAVDDGLWRWQIDYLTLLDNGLASPAQPPTIDEILGMRLGPLSQVSLRAPRQVHELGPLIHSAYAYHTAAGARVVACVSDYDGIARVLFVDAEGKSTPLQNDGRGPWFFSLDLDAMFAGTATLRAESVRTHEVPDPAGGTTMAPLSSQVPVAIVFRKEKQPPVFEEARYNPATRYLYVKVLPGGDLADDLVDWVKVFWDTGTAAGTVEFPQPGASLGSVPNRFEDPYGYAITFAAGATVPPLSELRLVAQTVGRLYRAVPLSSLVGVFTSGTGAQLHAEFDYTGADWWYIEMAELEKTSAAPAGYSIEQTAYVGAWYLSWYWKALLTAGRPELWTAADGLADVYLRDTQWQCRYFYLCFFRGAVSYTPGEVAYQGVDRTVIAGLAASMYAGYLDDAAAEACFLPNYGDVYLFKTSDQRYAKLVVRGYGTSWDDWTNWCGSTLTYDYVVYDPQYAPYP